MFADVARQHASPPRWRLPFAWRVSRSTLRRHLGGRQLSILAAATILLSEAGAFSNTILAPWAITRTLDRRLDKAAAAAVANPSRETIDPDAVRRMLEVDPLVRAQRALYDAALLTPQRALLARMSTPQDTTSGILDAARRLELILAPSRPSPSARTAAPSFGNVTTVARTIAAAAELAGIDGDFLSRTAGRESTWNPYAFARTSSARGLFQFVRDTWFSEVAKWGGKYGLGREAAAIKFDARGHPYVPDASLERQILALRYEPYYAASMAAEFSAENAQVLKAGLGREPSGRELYAAHVLGAEGALRLIRTAYGSPEYPAAALLPRAATANRSLFYLPHGAPRSVSELLGALS